MTQAVFNGIRGRQDIVSLVLGGETVIQSESYQVKSAILTQPSAFSMRLGTGDSLAKLLAKYPPNTPFQLKINDITYQTGRTDSRGSAATGHDELVLGGRDLLSVIHDGSIPEEFTLSDPTYGDMIKKVLVTNGLTDAALVGSNAANRGMMCGTKRDLELEGPRDALGEKVENEAKGVPDRKLEAHFGERWLEYIHRHIGHAGLFLWSAADGKTFILSEPNPSQVPLYQLLRKYKTTNGVSNACTIISETFNDDTVGRCSECRVYTRGASKKKGRQQAQGIAHDKEMVGYGFTRVHVEKDVNAKTPKRAEFWARKWVAESIRRGWRLSYKVYGHTTKSMIGEHVCWTPDTVVYVDDEKLGLRGNYYIEGVTFDASPHTTTTLDLMRIDSLIFSDKVPA